MKKIIAMCLVATLAAACNTRQNSNEPTVDSRVNPAELPVDSVGGNNDMTDKSSTDSNKTADPNYSAGKSDLQKGGGSSGGKAISSDGNIVGGPQDTTGSTLPAKSR